MKKLMILTGALTALAVCANEVPEISDVTMAQSSESRLVTITYTLDKGPAVVTLDIQTNATGNVWATIGGESIQNVSGDVWKKIETGAHTISWHPDISWPNHKIADGGIRAVVTAWSVDNPPDYMVVNLASNAVANSETYYPAVEFLPGGILKNTDYRTSHLVMRKIPAKGVTWTMGCGSEPGRASSDGATHTVTFTNNYYMAVFETTQAQWALIQTARPTPSYFTTDRLMRPAEQISYNEVRNAANSATANSTYFYPAAPNPGSFLGLLRTKTGLAFDLPSEAQWQFACRAGHGTGYWGDGSKITNSDTDANLAKQGRYLRNAGNTKKPSANCSLSYGSAIVGSYAPNSWGLYDMHGNVWEWCLDFYASDITKLGGAVNTSGTSRVQLGGSWYNPADRCRSGRREYDNPAKRGNNFGFRVMLPANPTLVKTE